MQTTETPHQGKGAIFAALAANVGIAISKLVAFLFTGSAAMLAEAGHSLADSSNQILLLIGGRQSRREPNRTHPFGYGRAHFVYAFMVSIVLFVAGGVFAFYEGIEKINHPVALDAPIIAYIVLAIAIFSEGLSLRTALHEAKDFKPKNQNWWQFLRTTKSVNHVVLALEDSAALVGLSFAAVGISLELLTGNPIWDGVATLCIGALLIAVAAFLFFEVQSLLIGEAVDADTERKLRRTILSVEEVDHVVDLKTLYTGPNEIFIAMKITVGGRDTAHSIAKAIDEVEALIRRELPIARLIYIEPDIYKSKEQQKRSDKAMEQELHND